MNLVRYINTSNNVNNIYYNNKNQVRFTSDYKETADSFEKERKEQEHKKPSFVENIINNLRTFFNRSEQRPNFTPDEIPPTVEVNTPVPVPVDYCDIPPALRGSVVNEGGFVPVQLPSIDIEAGSIREPIVVQPNHQNNFSWIFEDEEDESEPQSKMADFLNRPDYDKKIKIATEGKYQEYFQKMFSKEGLDKDTRKSLVNSDLSEEEFLSALKKLSKSTFKAALNNPTQYINYTQDEGFIGFQVSSIIDHSNFENDEDEARAYMLDFFKRNIVKLTKALKFIDTDTLNQMMDKRSTSFSFMLNSLDGLTEENAQLLKELLGHTKKGDARQKIELCQLVEIFQTNKFDMQHLRDLLEQENIDTESLNQFFKEALLKKAGLEKANEKTRTDFNKEYIHLIFSRLPVLNRGAFTCVKEFDDLIKASVKGEFEEFILDDTNEYGIANKNTKQQFEQYNLNYNQWLHPQIESGNFDLNGKPMKLKLWERNPYEDLFIGNKTRCCTAIATGSNGAAIPIFLMNTAFNLIELYDDKNNVKGMARIYMTQTDDENALVIDSIELTDAKELSDEDKKEIAKNIFSYASKYAQSVADKKIPVYYIEEDSKMPLDYGKAQQRKTKLIGDVSTDKVYSNSNSSLRWGDIRDSRYVYFYSAA